MKSVDMVEVKRFKAKQFKAKQTFPVRIDPDVILYIRDLGDQFDFNPSEYIRTAIDEKLARDLAKAQALLSTSND